MCGIAGFVGERWVASGTWQRMLDVLAPRGPDSRRASTWTKDFAPADERAQLALLHTRLSIRDLRVVAHQPMANPAGDVWICYNGEVYGWEGDAAELARRGYAFNTTSDTEFILHGYSEWGIEALLPRLRGKFALALLDRRAKKLYLVRDRLGIKPLIYRHRGRDLVFGSTVRSLLPYLGPGERQLAPSSIDAYLAHRYVPAPATIFHGVRRLRPGHYACFDIDSGAFDIAPYWQPRPDASLELERVLRESIQLRTVSDRPLGLFLSGGIDSTTVASVLADSGHREVTAYTASFPDTDYDEAAQAAAVARELGLPHKVLPIEENVGEDFERIVADLDEPFADPSSIPLWYIARAASAQVRVVMGGDGGDELFAGYKRYAKHLRTRWRRGLRLPIPPVASARLPSAATRLRDEISMDWACAYSLRFSGMAPSLRRYLQPDLAGAPAVYWDRMPQNADASLETLLAIDMHNYLPEYILRKGDLCTMAHGLELRVPLLDHLCYEAALSMPRERRFTEPAKLALAPACSLCTRLGMFAQKKRGFNPPLDRWLRGPLRARLDDLGTRLEDASNQQIAGGRVQSMVQAFLQHRAASAEHVLQLLMLEVSLRQLRAAPELSAAHLG